MSRPGTSETSRSANATSSGVAMPNVVPSRARAATAREISGCAWPRIIAPQLQHQSVSSRPSAVRMRAPFPDSTNTGVPPTPLNARTGLFTPPGIAFFARLNNASCFFSFVSMRTVYQKKSESLSDCAGFSVYTPCKEILK